MVCPATKKIETNTPFCSSNNKPPLQKGGLGDRSHTVSLRYKKIGVIKITPNHFFVAGERLELSTS